MIFFKIQQPKNPSKLIVSFKCFSQREKACWWSNCSWVEHNPLWNSSITLHPRLIRHQSCYYSCFDTPNLDKRDPSKTKSKNKPLIILNKSVECHFAVPNLPYREKICNAFSSRLCKKISFFSWLYFYFKATTLFYFYLRRKLMRI